MAYWINLSDPKGRKTRVNVTGLIAIRVLKNGQYELIYDNGTLLYTHGDNGKVLLDKWTKYISKKLRDERAACTRHIDK